MVLARIGMLFHCIFGRLAGCIIRKGIIKQMVMLDFRQLQIFMAVWECRSISRAADAVHLTQPTVSAHLKALEDELGIKLFDRTSRKVVPTAAARILYPYIKRIIKLNRQAREELSAFMGEEKGMLELGASNIPGQYLLPVLVGEFKNSRPGIKIKINIDDTAGTVEKVSTGLLELGIVGAPLARKKLVFEECFSDELFFVTGPDEPAGDYSHITLDMLPEMPMIMRESGSGTRQTIENSLQPHGISMNDLNVVMEMGSTEAVRQAVKAGLGCAIISRRAVEDDIKCGLLRTVPLEGVRITRFFYTVRARGRTLPPLAESFLEFMFAKSASENAG